ncbi:uncharacterized protein LOC144129624 [Amblyomma americanum]
MVSTLSSTVEGSGRCAALEAPDALPGLAGVLVLLTPDFGVVLGVVEVYTWLALDGGCCRWVPADKPVVEVGSSAVLSRVASLGDFGVAGTTALRWVTGDLALAISDKCPGGSPFVLLGGFLPFYLLRKRRQQNARRTRRSRSVWMRSMCRHRNFGHSGLLIPLLRQSDLPYFLYYIRMLPGTFEKILALVGLLIERQDTSWRQEISARTRLEITLRFLASGDSQRSLSFAYMMVRSTVCTVISETSQAIWDALKHQYVRCPLTPEEWLDVAQEFMQGWNVPNCIAFHTSTSQKWPQSWMAKLLAVVQQGNERVLEELAPPHPSGHM